jgi:hypothetical protein
VPDECGVDAPACGAEDVGAELIADHDGPLGAEPKAGSLEDGRMRLAQSGKTAGIRG